MQSKCVEGEIPSKFVGSFRVFPKKVFNALTRNEISGHPKSIAGFIIGNNHKNVFEYGLDWGIGFAFAEFVEACKSQGVRAARVAPFNFCYDHTGKIYIQFDDGRTYSV